MNHNTVSTLIRKVQKNTQGADYAVGDIHGCFSKLEDKLNSIGFDPSKDRLFSVGDLVDRGPESHDAVEWLYKPWFYAIKGNHEQMLLEYVDGYLTSYQYGYNGGDWFVFMYDELLKRDFYDNFSKLPLIIEVETEDGLVAIAHSQIAGTCYDTFKEELLNLDSKQSARMQDIALWSRDRVSNYKANNIIGLKALVSGHTVLEIPMILGNHYCVDTGAVFDGEFTLLNLQTLEFL